MLTGGIAAYRSNGPLVTDGVSFTLYQHPNSRPSYSFNRLRRPAEAFRPNAGPDRTGTGVQRLLDPNFEIRSLRSARKFAPAVARYPENAVASP
jgi:hypothetical protein